MRNQKINATFHKFSILTLFSLTFCSLSCGDSKTMIPPDNEMTPGVFYGNLAKINVRIALETGNQDDPILFFECQQTNTPIFTQKKTVVTRLVNKKGQTIGPFRNLPKKWTKAGQGDPDIFKDADDFKKAMSQLAASGVFDKAPECDEDFCARWLEMVGHGRDS